MHTDNTKHLTGEPLIRMDDYKKPLGNKIVKGNEYVRLTVLIADFVLLNLLMWVALETMGSWVPEYFDRFTKITVMVMNFSMLISEYYFRTIIHKRLLRTDEVVGNVGKLVTMQAVTMFVLLRLLSDGGGLFRFMLVFTPAFFVVILMSRLLELSYLKSLRKKGRNSSTVLFVGNDNSLARLYKDLTQTPAVGYVVRGYYAEEPMVNTPKGLEFLGTLDDLNAMLDKMDADPLVSMGIDELFCSISHTESRQVERIVRSCDKNVVKFYYVPRDFGDYDLNLRMQRFGDYTVFTNHSTPLESPVNRFIKRTFDICVSLAVCVVLIPVTVVVGLLIKLQSPGHIFFKQARTGINGKTFFCYKFRSMHVNKDADKLQATEDDPRKFAFGNFMRKTNLDEFPQFFNVLKGDMSIVGPRPHMLHHTEVYGKLISKYMVRHFCQPGITGWAQVTGYRGETKELWQMEERVKRDIWYVEHWSFLLDLRIMYLTAKSIFIHDSNAY